MNGLMSWHTGFPWTPVTGQINSVPITSAATINPTRPSAVINTARTDTSNSSFITPDANFPALSIRVTPLRIPWAELLKRNVPTPTPPPVRAILTLTSARPGLREWDETLVAVPAISTWISAWSKNSVCPISASGVRARISNCAEISSTCSTSSTCSHFRLAPTTRAWKMLCSGALQAHCQAE